MVAVFGLFETFSNHPWLDLAWESKVMLSSRKEDCVGGRERGQRKKKQEMIKRKQKEGVIWEPPSEELN